MLYVYLKNERKKEQALMNSVDKKPQKEQDNARKTEKREKYRCWSDGIERVKQKIDRTHETTRMAKEKIQIVNTFISFYMDIEKKETNIDQWRRLKNRKEYKQRNKNKN